MRRRDWLQRFQGREAEQRKQAHGRVVCSRFPLRRGLRRGRDADLQRMDPDRLGDVL
jgi:hypothetical protein